MVSQSSAPLISVLGNVVPQNSKTKGIKDSECKSDSGTPPINKCNNCKSEFGRLIEQIVSSVNSNGKAKICIEIEISKD